MENEFFKEYKERVVPALRAQHGYKNDLQIPKLEKVVINTSVGSHSDVKQALEDAKTELALITGQRPAETRAKKSISNFKLRKEPDHRGQGDTSGRADVRIHGAPDQGRASSHSRLSRDSGERI
jgi:hypothetical protein